MNVLLKKKIWKIKPQYAHGFESASLQISAIVPAPIICLQARARHTFCQEGKREGSLLGGGGEEKKKKVAGMESTGGMRPHTPPAASRASPPPDTHPHDHHLDGHVLGEADRGPEVHGQGHEEMQDGHQVLPVNCLSGEGRRQLL